MTGFSAAPAMLRAWWFPVFLAGCPVVTAGDTDETDAPCATWFADVDGDLHGDPATALVSCTAPPGWVSEGTDCDDENPYVFGGNDDVAGDGLDQDCDGADTAAHDADGDGFSDAATGGTDCDDGSAAVYPGAPEVLGDAVDDDCDGVLDTDVDADGDGHRAVAAGGDDCEDVRSPLVYWGAYEFLTVVQGSPYDYDCDGFHLGNNWTDLDLDDDGWTAGDRGGGDCDDTAANISPGANEIPHDGVDQDCDGYDLDPTGWPMKHDRDSDGHIDAADGGDDCDDTRLWTHPQAYDFWGDGIDDDCSGSAADADGDGQAGPADDGPDCDDHDASVVAFLAAEIPGDGVDQDCDGHDGVDADRDGDPSEASGGGDCDDADPTRWTGAADVPDDGIDQDCDGEDASGDADADGVAADADCDDHDASAGVGCDAFVGVAAPPVSPCPDFSGVTLDGSSDPPMYRLTVGGHDGLDAPRTTVTRGTDGTALIERRWFASVPVDAYGTSYWFDQSYRCDARGLWLVRTRRASGYGHTGREILDESQLDEDTITWYDGYLLVPARGLVAGDAWTNAYTAYTWTRSATWARFDHAPTAWTWATSRSAGRVDVTVGAPSNAPFLEAGSVRAGGDASRDIRVVSAGGVSWNRWYGPMAWDDWEAVVDP